jgi:hypothetical protein
LRAFVSYWDAGVFIFDIGDPTSPRLQGQAADTSYGSEGNVHSADEMAGGYLLTAEEFGYRSRPPTLRLEAQNGNGKLGIFGCEAPGDASLPADQAIDARLIDLGDGCAPVAPPRDANPVVGLVDQTVGRCSVRDKVVNARQLGAEAVIVVQERDAASLENLDTSGQLPVPVVVVGHRDGERLRNLGIAQGVRVLLPSSRPSGGLQVWDIHDPTRPALLSEFRTEHGNDYPRNAIGGYTIHNPLVIGRHALASWYSDGIRLLDLSDPRLPREVAAFVPPAVPDPEGRQPTAPLVWGVARTADLLLASDINGGLYVLQVDGLPAE